MLYREAQSIAKIAKRLGKPEEETMLVLAQAETLKKSIIASWNADQSFIPIATAKQVWFRQARSSPRKKETGTHARKWNSKLESAC
ncbi:MAG: hypothetical protein IPO36_07100 [Anaerolineales bacterium]|nr:hypothetical protein [Anaerolineales bacterium]